MKSAYVSLYDAKDVNNWSGLGYFISKALEDQSISFDYIGPLKSRKSFSPKVKLYNLFGQYYSKGWDERTLFRIAKEVNEKLKDLDVEYLFGPGPMPFVYLETDKPIFTWTDSCFPGLIDFYEGRKMVSSSYNHAMKAQKLILEKSTLSIFSSDWAASIAINKHGINPEKVAVVPFGANLNQSNTISEIKTSIKSRSENICKILFIGVDWYRKGGDVVLEVTKLLNKRGIRTELTIVGCDPISSEPLPDYVNPLGFISKRTQEGRTKINNLLSSSHFLFVPSRAEAYGLVFCEANAFGVPAISSNVGGITTIIKNDINGKTFSVNSKYENYADYFEETYKNKMKYESLSLSSFNEFILRLNWEVAGKKVKDLIQQKLIGK